MMLCSVMISDDVSSLSSLYNNKGNLLTDKIVLSNADNEKKKKSDIIVIIKEASESLTPQIFKRKSKWKWVSTAVILDAMFDWASLRSQSDLKHHWLMRDILSELSMFFSEDSECSDCVTQSHLCVICENCIKCVSCTAQSADYCDWISVKISILTVNQIWVYLLFSLFI